MVRRLDSKFFSKFRHFLNTRPCTLDKISVQYCTVHVMYTNKKAGNNRISESAASDCDGKKKEKLSSDNCFQEHSVIYSTQGAATKDHDSVQCLAGEFSD